MKVDITKLELHQSVLIDCTGPNTPKHNVIITKVIGGWIYLPMDVIGGASVFVPEPQQLNVHLHQHQKER